MNKIFLLSAAVLFAIATMLPAQNASQRQRQGQFNPEEMVKRQIDDMKTKYKLTQSQADTLTAMFKERFASFGQRPQGQGQGQQGQRTQAQGQRQGQGQGQAVQRQTQEQRQAQQDAFNKRIQQVLTPEQYKAYQKDQTTQRQQMQQRGGQGQQQRGVQQGQRGGQGGNRGGGNFNNDNFGDDDF